MPAGSRIGSGYVLRAGGCSTFHSGDTVLLEDHYGLEDIDVLLLPICTYSPTLRALPEVLSPEYVIPLHYSTFEILDTDRHWTYGDPEEVRRVMAHPERLAVLELGEPFRPSG